MDGAGRRFPEVHVTECAAQLGKARVSVEATQFKSPRISDTDTFISSLGMFSQA